MNRRARAFLIVSVLAAVGTVVTVLLYIDTRNGETSLAHESFKGEFSSLLSEFKGFMAGQLRGLGAISDAISSHDSLPSAPVFQRIGRTYEGIFKSAFGGIGILARVNNTKAAKDAWAAATSLRYNRTVKPIILPPYADAEDPFVYMIQDDLPYIPSVPGYQGLEITALDHVRQPIWSMINHTSSSANSSVLVELFGKLVGFTGLIEFTRVLDVSQWGFLSFVTVFDEDPTAYLVMTATLFDDFVADFRRRSPQAALTITDANGFAFHSGNCDLVSAKQVLELEVPLTSAATWRIQVGQCPDYDARFITWKRYVILAICIVVTLLAVLVSAVVLLYQERLVQDAIERIRHEEKATAHQIIVGYICHELRNPLHIIKTSFSGMQAALRKLSGNQFLRGPTGIGSNDAALNDADDVDLLEEAPNEEELQSIVLDAQSALHQMQATVNEVLDYRAIDTGLSSLKLNVEPIMISEAVMPVLLRSRAFLAPSVPMRVVICQPEAVVCVDRHRLNQIITNGLSNAGKFTDSGEVRVTLSIETLSTVMRMYGPTPRRLSRGNSIKDRISKGSSMFKRNGRVMVLENGAEIDVKASMVDEPDEPQFVCLTISNSRGPGFIAKPEDCFIPFKQKGGAGAWKPVQASSSHISSMKSLWIASMDRAKSVDVVTLPELKSHRTGPVKVTTGLGLPLCRGFAHASGGWLALDETQGDGFTHFWCVLKSEPRQAHLSSESKQLLNRASTLNSNPEQEAKHLGPASPAPQPASGDTLVKVSPADDPISPGRMDDFTVTSNQSLARQQHPTAEFSEVGTLSTGQDAKTGYDGLAPPTVITAGLGGVNFNALRIALVDDEPANQRVAARFLKGLGVDPDNILILSDGDDALELLKGTYFPIAAHHGSSPPHTPVTAPRPQLSFDVMFLDIRMPGKSGIDVMKEIAGPLPCPVIAMTGNVDKDSVNEYKAARFSGCLGKPFERKLMKQAIEFALQHKWFSLVSMDG